MLAKMIFDDYETQFKDNYIKLRFNGGLFLIMKSALKNLFET